MQKEFVKKMREALAKKDIKRYTIYMNNSYLINVSDALKVIYDDSAEIIHVFRVPANSQPLDPRTILYETFAYETIERFAVATDTITLNGIIDAIGLKLTDEVTEFLKTAGSQQGLYPAQSNPSEVDGEPNNYNQMPFVASVKS
ncbi:MAG: hypothetical protein NC453_27205 [Muribaculum sp.]|nr:hypothetical protein [Muribaculum sp.]